MVLRIDPAARTAPYEQLRQQVIDQIRAGTLLPGTRLPPVRRLAEDLGIAPNTVARAYRELEAAGHVETAGRHGTRVALQRPDVSAEADRLTHEYLTAMRALGLDTTAIAGYLRTDLGSELD
ncbi:GntR family transcriptional regulator [Raineyella sp. W15-4]|uniref:GntR family transcriptional regulator n=1 Tax=Raineyella sp. W15-4 TaxID=3081651 RepID=UPI002952AFFA|nr:GntR family transcriptional regulator [Raineyella sp. W15-4]WOQ17960.1 GntR family transcriptional regulator [Raineyella sp. W15-4]